MLLLGDGFQVGAFASAQDESALTGTGSHDQDNDVTLIVWTSLTVSLDGEPTANAIMLKILDRIYTVSPLR